MKLEETEACDEKKTALQRAQETMMLQHNLALNCARSAAPDSLTGVASQRAERENAAKLWVARSEIYKECARIIGEEAMRDAGLSKS